VKVLVGSVLFSALLVAAVPPSVSRTFLDKLPLRFEHSRAGEGYEARGNHFSLRLQSVENVLDWSDHGKTARVRTRLMRANPAATLAPEERLPGSANYFVGAPALWRTDVSGFSRVRYQSVYDGIDLVFHGEAGRLEYDFVVAPHADPRAIRLELNGQRSLQVSTEGDLVVSTDAGDVRWKRPEIYQDVEGVRQSVAGRFVVEGKRVVRFEIGSYDRNRTLVVDPTLAYATFLGGTGKDGAKGIGIDGAGNVYIAGATSTTELNTVSAFQPNFGGRTVGNFVVGDGFVAKFSPTGTLLYLTYIGGSQDDGVSAIAVDAAGNAYLAGATDSPDFPIVGGYQKQYGGSTPTGTYIRTGDAFVAKLNPSGNQLIYSTYLGGAEDDIAFAIAIDAAGNAYVAGATASFNFPLTPGGGEFQNTMHGLGGEPVKACCALPFWDPGDAFIAKLDPTGSQLLFSTYLGGAQDDVALAIAVDSSSNVYVAGCTISGNFPIIKGSLQTTFGGSDPQNYAQNLGDGFIAKLNPTGSSLIYSTYLGGTGDDCVTAIALDSSGDVYMTGSTDSSNMPVSQGVVQPSFAGFKTIPINVEQNLGDAFVGELNPAGTALVYFTYLGGGRNDSGAAIALDGFGDAYVVGFTDSTDFPLSASPLQSQMAGDSGRHYSVNAQGDGFLAVLNPTATALLYSTYVGGSDDDALGGVVLDGKGNVYVAGGSSSLNMPVTSANAYQAKYGGGGDAYYAVFSGFSLAPPAITKVANAEGESATIAPNTWVEVKGTQLAPDTRTWQASDFAAFNNQLPTALDTVSVTFNGEKAFVYYISSTQINVLTPPDMNVSSGSVTVQVIFNGVPSGPVVVPAQTYSASFFVDNGGPYVLATHAPGAGGCPAPINGVCLVGPTTLYPGYSTPAQPGETIVIYANGFGPTTPAAVIGSLTQSGTLTPPPAIHIDGALIQPNPVSFAGLISPGLYQFNVTMPSTLTGGDHMIQAINPQGSTTQAGTLITIQ
jgi:uncharacterized protein (TIGR03437 family)